MGIIWTILIGFIIGILAKFVHPGRENMGFIVTTLIGIAGAFIATFLGQAIGWYQPDQAAGWIASILGAVLLLWIYGRMKGQTA